METVFSTAFGVVFNLALSVFGQTDSPYYLESLKPKAAPQRVVSLAPNLTEIMFELGMGERIVGVTRYDDYPNQVESIPKVGGFIDPCMEAILSLKPDLVITTTNPGGKHKLLPLTTMGVSVLVLPSYRLEDIATVMAKLGEVFDCLEKAESLIQKMNKRVRQIEQAVKSHRKPKVLLAYGHKPLMVAGTGSFPDQLIALAGGKNCITNSKVRYPMLPLEEVIRLQPEVIIDASSSGMGAEISRAEILRFWATLGKVQAVKNQQIHLFDSALWFRPGPRIVYGLQELVKILHPQIHLELPSQ